MVFIMNPIEVFAEEPSEKKYSLDMPCLCTENPYTSLQGTFIKCWLAGSSVECSKHGNCYYWVGDIKWHCGYMNPPPVEE